jgi:hypothetical protein
MNWMVVLAFATVVLQEKPQPEHVTHS